MILKIFRFDADAGKRVTKYDSDFIMSRIVQTEKASYIGCMHLKSGGVVGYHQAVIPQLLLVVDGEGVMRGQENSWVQVRPGEAEFWERDEWHETKTKKELTAIVIESETLTPEDFMPVKYSHHLR